MALKKKTLGTLLLQKNKGANELLADSEFTLDEFAVVNENSEEEMICLTHIFGLQLFSLTSSRITLNVLSGLMKHYLTILVKKMLSQ